MKAIPVLIVGGGPVGLTASGAKRTFAKTFTSTKGQLQTLCIANERT